MKKGKKLLVALLAGALAVATMAAFAACGNSHTWSENWSSDATSHWHACTDEGCTEVSDKAGHTFDEGEEAKAATYNSEGEKVYRKQRPIIPKAKRYIPVLFADMKRKNRWLRLKRRESIIFRRKVKKRSWAVWHRIP